MCGVAVRAFELPPRPGLGRVPGYRVRQILVERRVNRRFRRILVIAGSSGKGPLTEPAAASSEPADKVC